MNKGLGHSFLRHIERCKALLYVLDASNSELSMCTQLEHLQTELKCYSHSLCDHIGLVVANKMDKGSYEASVARLQERVPLPIIPVSALHKWNIQPLKAALFKLTL